jgi:rare lipoprotein A
MVVSLGVLWSSQSLPAATPRGGAQKMEGYAAWYDVPKSSLAKKRAGQEELTAAHNGLPLGTLVRVTHLENNKSVVVRITDRGIGNRRYLIDLCKEAAQRLDMLSAGQAKVRLEVVPDKSPSPPPEKKPWWKWW